MRRKFVHQAWGMVYLAFAGWGWSQEAGSLCEVRPRFACLDKSLLDGHSLVVPKNAIGIAGDGLSICDSSYRYTTAPDIVLIMDNTGSMGVETVIDGTPRYCPTPNNFPSDPGCISGDPDTLRAEALHVFLDSALAKGAEGTRVAVISFNDQVEYASSDFTDLNADNLQDIKDEIIAQAYQETNYHAALTRARSLFALSTKPTEERIIIFVSDGRPNRPTPRDGEPDGPDVYKNYLSELPPVHSIFLGDNSNNYAPLQEISQETGGLFFPVRDVSRMASILTDSIARQVFRRATPTRTTVTNTTTNKRFIVDADGHVAAADSSRYSLVLPGPLYLEEGENDILVQTLYGSGNRSQDVRFTLTRSASEEPDTSLGLECRDPARIVVRNGDGVNLAALDEPFSLGDEKAFYELVTEARADSIRVEAVIRGSGSAQEDFEFRGHAVLPGEPEYEGDFTFQHQTRDKSREDGRLQAEDGETLVITYRNPYLPPDTAQARVRIRYGARLVLAYYADRNGDGRIETVVIQYGEELGALPDVLEFTLPDPDGEAVVRRAMREDGEIAFDEDDGDEVRNRLVVTLENPFPYGITSVPEDPTGRTFRQLEVPLVDGTFSVGDSTAPVILDAVIREPGRNEPLKRIVVTFSEPVELSENALEPLVFKRDTLVFDREQISVNRIERESDNVLVVYLDAGTGFSPVGGDSVAIATNGEIRDGEGRAPDTRVFRALEGATPEQRVREVYATFGNGSRGAPSEPPSFSIQTRGGVVPVDSLGSPLPGDEDGKCGRCRVGEGNDRFYGSVIHVVTPEPVDYTLKIFSNLGDLVAQMSGRIEEDDLRLLSRELRGEGEESYTYYTQRFVWTGHTLEGRMAGTGAYVLRAEFSFDRNLKTGAKASREVRVTRFGFLRGCCESVVEWYE